MMIPIDIDYENGNDQYSSRKWLFNDYYCSIVIILIILILYDILESMIHIQNDCVFIILMMMYWYDDMTVIIFYCLLLIDDYTC